jgi:arabinofuranan 3-O-arabinosyltransferase
VLVHLGLALLLYVPLLLTRPGRVGADTKTYLYLDPAELLARATSMWDPNVGMGTVTHQTIGYLFPMGPWYWVFERLGAPDWVAQRLWLATVMFAAVAGVLFLTRTLGWPAASAGPAGGAPPSKAGVRGPTPVAAGPIVAALTYGLSPYVLDYAARISVILLPWAALPWLVALAERALRRGGWRHPALFALVVLAVGGVNATALVFAGLAPVLWFPFAVARGDATARRALATVGRIGVLTTAVSLWWVAGLAVQGAYGIEVLRYTETVQAVARTSLASEVLRGLGYWFFYGNDKLGPWIEPSVPYTQSPVLLAVTFALPAAAMVAAALVRWRHRAYCVTLVAVGTVIAVGAHPYDSPSPVGAQFKAFAASSTPRHALRSTARALPLVVLGFALLLGAAVTALVRSVPRAAFAVAPACAVLAVGALPPLFTGDLAAVENLDRPERLPAWWPEAGRHLDARSDDGTRVLELPGSDFAAYRWGNTVDPVTPYLMDRPYVARELIPYGAPASADLLNALDRRLQEGVFEPTSLVPVARLMGVGHVVLRNDLQHERYRTPRPRSLWRDMTSPRPPGLGEPAAFGPSTPNRPVPRLPLVDEIELATPPAAPHPPRVAAFPVTGSVPIVRVEDDAAPILVDGDGEGIVDLAAAGLLRVGVPVHYAATADDATLQRGTLVVTDTNRLRARRWGTVRENTGYTEARGLSPLRDDPGDARLDVFGGGAPDDAYTTVEQRGVRSVRATAYGNPVSYTPEDRPANALDGDAGTAWRVGAFADVTGERLRVDLATPKRIAELRLVQPQRGPRNRWITRLRVHLDGEAFDVALDESSRAPAGQVVQFPDRVVRRVELEVRDTNVGLRPRYDGVSGVGFAEVGVSGTRVEEVVRMPRHLLRRAGGASAGRPLALVMTRLRANPAEPVRSDEEPALARTFRLPTSRSFRLEGTGRVSAYAGDEVIDRVVQAVAPGEPSARSGSRLPGSLRSRAHAAIDGDPSTAWTPGFLAQAGHVVEVLLAAPATIDRLDLRVVDDGRHSAPLRLRIDVDGAAGARHVDVPADGGLVRFEPVRGSRLRFVVESVRHERTIDYYSEAPIELPVAIAELGIPGVVAPPPRGLAGDCRNDLLTIDGRPVAVRVSGDAGRALDRGPLTVVACEDVALGPGDHVVRAAPGAATGIDLDRLVLTSLAGGGAGPLKVAHDGVPPARPDGGVRVAKRTRTSYDLAVAPAVPGAGVRPLLVLGQSHNRGWRATDQSGRDLGPPLLVDGYANGWPLPPGTTRVHLEWRPQRMVWVALALSAVAALVCLALAVLCRAEPGVTHQVPGDSTGWGVPRGRVPWRWAVGAAAFGLLAGGPWVGAATAAVVVAARLLRNKGATLLASAPAAFLSAAAAYVVVQQVRYGYPPDFAWPTNMGRAHPLAWTAVACLVTTIGTDRSEVR